MMPSNLTASRMVAVRLRGLADTMVARPGGDQTIAVLIDAFEAAAMALESARTPPDRRQVLALVSVLTAGFEKLSTRGGVTVALAANDVQ